MEVYDGLFLGWYQWLCVGGYEELASLWIIPSHNDNLINFVLDLCLMRKHDKKIIKIVSLLGLLSIGVKILHTINVN